MDNQAIKRETSSPPKMTIRVTGPRVGEKRLSVSDLTEIVFRTQQALKRIGQVLYGQNSGSQGRKKKDIEDLCELFMVDWQSGSAIAELELGAPPAQLNMFGYIGEQSLAAFIQGIHALSQNGSPAATTPVGFDRGVLQTCHALGRVLEHGIEAIEFNEKKLENPKSATFNLPVRNRLQTLLQGTADETRAVKVGRIEELNGHGQLTGRLWEPDTTRWTCYFSPEHVEILQEAWMRVVKLAGKAIVEEGKERSLLVETIEIADQEDLGPSAEVTSPDFWTSIPLEELIESQGVPPANDLDEIAALWPEDDDPDVFLERVLADRRQRRSQEN